MAWQGYIGLRYLTYADNVTWRQDFWPLVQALGPGAGGAHELNHWRSVPDRNLWIFEANWPDADITAANFETELATGMGKPASEIDIATSAYSFGGLETTIFKYTDNNPATWRTDLVEVYLFGTTGATLAESRAEAIGYLDRGEAWNRAPRPKLGFYDGIDNLNAISNISGSRTVIQGLKTFGVNHELRLDISSNQQVNKDYFDMLVDEGFLQGIRPDDNLANQSASDITPATLIDGHAGVAHWYMGHEVMEYMDFDERVALRQLVQGILPNTPMIYYWGGAIDNGHDRAGQSHGDPGQTYDDFVIGKDHNEGVEPQGTIIFHCSLGNATKGVTDFTAKRRNAEALRAYVEHYCSTVYRDKFTIEMAYHMNFSLAETDSTWMADGLIEVSKANPGWLYMRFQGSPATDNHKTAVGNATKEVGWQP